MPRISRGRRAPRRRSFDHDHVDQTRPRIAQLLQSSIVC
jgi:hypothetical protein